MDYDQTTIASTYDTARVMRPDAMQRWLDLVIQHAPPQPKLVVDVGCGTGRFTLPLARLLAPARVVGVDPSAKMLDAARGKAAPGRVEFLQAAAEHLPFDDGSADLVFMSMMLHHLQDRPRAAKECRRVLRKGGRLCIRNSTRDSTYPHPRFFPGFQAIVNQELPSRDEVVTLFEGAGLALCADQVITHPLAGSWGELADKLALRADSFIVRLPDDEFERGMAALRAHAARGTTDEPIMLDLQFLVFEA